MITFLAAYYLSSGRLKSKRVKGKSSAALVARSTGKKTTTSIGIMPLLGF